MFPFCTDRHARAALVAIACMLPAQPAAAQVPSRSGTELRSFADQYLERGDLLKAIEHYRAALKELPAAQAQDRQHCDDRLLMLFQRIGRHDLAIVLGKDYADRLARAGLEPRRRAVLQQMGVCYLALGHARDAQQRFEEALRDAPPGLEPLVRIEAHAHLARFAEKQKRLDEADEHWLQVRDAARKELIKPPAELEDRGRALCVRRLAQSDRFLKQPDEAIARLERLAADQERRSDHADRCDTLCLLAEHHAALAADPGTGDTGLLAAEHDLRRAIAVYDLVRSPDPVRQGELRRALAALLGRRDEHGEAADWRAKAAELYRQALAGNPLKHPEHRGPAVAFWHLRQLAQRAEQFSTLLQLVGEPLAAKTPRRTPLEETRLEAEQSMLTVHRLVVMTARPSLEATVRALEQQPVMNLVDLPRVLISLAIVELSGATTDEADRDRVERAARLAHRVRALCEEHSLHDTALQAATWAVLGTCSLLRGDMDQAIAHYRTGVKRCDTDTPDPDRLRCGLLLRIAALQHSQHQLAEARKTCQEALEAYRASAGKNAKQQLGYACFLSALVTMDAKLCPVPEADGTLRGEAIDAVGLQAKELGRLCDEHRIREGPLLRTALHGQALAHFAHRKYGPAATLWRRLADIQRRAVIATPDHPEYDPLLPQTLNWLARATELQGKADAAEKLYEEARVLQSGRPADPATYHTTLWRLAGLLDRRGNQPGSRALLEQAMAVADEVRAQRQGAWSAQVSAAAERLVEQCVRDGRFADALAFSARSRRWHLVDQLQRAGVDLDKERAVEPPSDLLAALGKHVLRPGRAVVGYHIGSERSYVMLMSDRAGKPEVEAWPLTVSTRLLNAIPRAPGADAASAGDRAAPVTGANGAPAWPLNRRLLRQLVAHHLTQIADAEFTTRGLRLSWDSAVATPGEVLEQITEAILPRAVRARLKQLGVRHVLVVPDGALHRLPLESLVVQAGTAPRYVLDELSPITYAPPLSILARLAGDRSPRPAIGPRSLLTVCNPAYPGAKSPLRQHTPDAGAEVPLLPWTAEESKRIRGHFDPARMMVLDGPTATRQALRDNLAGRQVVHLAVHGVAGRLFLTPDKGDDGVLTLAEIHRLPLQACELALLSACATGVDPDDPLEAGATLAHAILMAGARRVIASQWRVADASSVELLSRFFEGAMAEDGKGRPFAPVLHASRRTLRDAAPASAPVTWAPLVLFGTGDDIENDAPIPELSQLVAEPVMEEPTWYAAPWFVPAAVIVSGVALALLLRLAVMLWRGRDEYRMPRL
jgi:CHAT domain-containing protein/tetratricopeptide (TPR) repeat protein